MRSSVQIIDITDIKPMHLLLKNFKFKYKTAFQPTNSWPSKKHTSIPKKLARQKDKGRYFWWSQILSQTSMANIQKQDRHLFY